MFSNHVVQSNKAKQSNKKISQTSTDTSPDNILVDWDEQISKWIIKTLQKNSRLGRNVIYNEVNKRYKKARRKRENLSKDVFDKHLKFLLENNIVDKNDAGQRGTKIEHFLTPESIQQLQTGTLNLRELKNQNKKQNKKLVKITPQMKVKALYILILMFNHATSFEFRNEDELISFLAPFRFKLGKLSEVRMANELESEETKKERRHFQTRIESQDKSVVVSIHKYVNPYHGGSTHVYYCQIRGMTKNIVNTNRNDMPFRYISFLPNQVNEAFDFLCRDQILSVVSNSDIYRISDTNLYFLLILLEDLFSEYVIPVMRKIWKYLRNPTPEERLWLTMLWGGEQADKMIIEYNEHRHELENEIRKKAQGIETVAKSMLNKKKIDTINEIEEQVKSIKKDLDSYQQTYDFLIKKHFSLQQILEIMFPEFLKHLEFRRSGRNNKES